MSSYLVVDQRPFVFNVFQRCGSALLYSRARASVNGLWIAANHPERIVVEALQVAGWIG